MADGGMEGAFTGEIIDDLCRYVLGVGLHDHDALQCGDPVYSGHWSRQYHWRGCRRRLAKNQGLAVSQQCHTCTHTHMHKAPTAGTLPIFQSAPETYSCS